MSSVKDKIKLPTKYGDADLYTFNGLIDGKEHVAITFGNWKAATAPLVRVHSECLTGDAFGSLRCDCGSQLDTFLKQLSSEGGILIYLRQEGRGIGLYNKIAAYKLQELGYDTFEANLALGFGEDDRGFLAGAEILRALEVGTVRLVTNNFDKVIQLKSAGISVQEVIHHRAQVCKENYSYLKAKQKKGHSLLLEIDSTEELKRVQA